MRIKKNALSSAQLKKKIGIRKDFLKKYFRHIIRSKYTFKLEYVFPGLYYVLDKNDLKNPFYKLDPDPIKKIKNHQK